MAKTTKKQLAKKLGVARSTLYYKPKLPEKDEQLKQLILKVWHKEQFPAYGYKRLALHLKVNKKRVQRVMRAFKLHPPRRRTKQPVKPGDLKQPAVKWPNLLLDEKGEPIPITRPDFAWAQDFTYLWFAGGWWYVATVIDVYTREVLGFTFGKHHDKQLILDALEQALSTGRKPRVLHSDQGSEYKSDVYYEVILKHGILLSYSKKASPWQNGFQESFYNNFKLDLGFLTQFETVGELLEAIYKTIYIYNHKRIHTALKMSPKQFYQKYQLTTGAAVNTVSV
jgi:putative transposase